MNIKKVILRIAGIAVLFLCAAGIVMLTAFNTRVQRSGHCTDLLIAIDHNTDIFFIDRQDVMHMLGTEYGDSVRGEQLQQIRVGRIEQILEKNPYIANAESWMDAKGVMHIEIVQKQPVARVINKYAVHYYIDNVGNKMPVSDKFTARVPVVTGSIEEGPLNADMATTPALQKTLSLVNFIRSDAFWSAQIEQVVVAADGRFTLIPKLGDHRIEFGKLDGMEEKFHKMKLFYSEGLNRTGWEKYSAFKLDYKGQIVGVKKDSL